LNGTKHFISNGSMAQWYVAFATRDRKARHAGISAFVFPPISRGSRSIV
jgi:alkylation response protein AidB-like acyl-CoA dehydrogenase